VRYDRTVDRPDRGEDRRRLVDSRGVSKRQGDREGSSNKRCHSHRRRSHSSERHRRNSCRPQRGDSRLPDDPSSDGASDNSDDDHSTVHRAKMTMSGFPECRDRGSNYRSSMEVSLGRAGGHTSKTALRTIVGVNAKNWRS